MILSILKQRKVRAIVFLGCLAGTLSYASGVRDTYDTLDDAVDNLEDARDDLEPYQNGSDDDPREALRSLASAHRAMRQEAQDLLMGSIDVGAPGGLDDFHRVMAALQILNPKVYSQVPPGTTAKELQIHEAVQALNRALE